MLVIGVEVSVAESMWVGLKGTAQSCTIELLVQPKLAVPQAVQAGVDRLLAFKANVLSALATAKPDKVAVIKATKDCSVDRVKNECMIQLACKELSIECLLLSPLTISAASKRRVEAMADPATHATLAGISPKYLQKAAYAAWCALPHA